MGCVPLRASHDHIILTIPIGTTAASEVPTPGGSFKGSVYYTGCRPVCFVFERALGHQGSVSLVKGTLDEEIVNFYIGSFQGH